MTVAKRRRAAGPGGWLCDGEAGLVVMVSALSAAWSARAWSSGQLPWSCSQSASHQGALRVHRATPESSLA